MISAQSELAELLAEPDLNVVYFDGAGFSVKGVVPYGWTLVGERAPVPFTGNQGSTVQALGLEHQNGDVSVYLHQGRVNTQTVVPVLEDYSRQIDQTTVIILDSG